ncbi:Centrosomal protein poc5 [Phlyctochytrium planicorne]|nr:Centrosomal protein poc5 [Phlyctochytrium planicorne]
MSLDDISAAQQKSIVSEITPNVEHPKQDIKNFPSEDLPPDNPDFATFGTSVDKWTGLMKKAIMAEFTDAHNAMVQRQDKAIEAVGRRYVESVASLTAQLREAHDLASLYARKFEARNMALEHAAAVISKKNSLKLGAIMFSRWRTKLIEERRCKLASKFAEQRSRSLLLRHIVLSWQRTTGATWKRATEKRIRKEAEKAITQLSTEYETRLAEMTSLLALTDNRLRESETERTRAQEEMKKALMRGVCALNMEAMSVFRGSSQPTVQNSTTDYKGSQPNDVLASNAGASFIINGGRDTLGTLEQQFKTGGGGTLGTSRPESSLKGPALSDQNSEPLPNSNRQPPSLLPPSKAVPTAAASNANWTSKKGPLKSTAQPSSKEILSRMHSRKPSAASSTAPTVIRHTKFTAATTYEVLRSKMESDNANFKKHIERMKEGIEQTLTNAPSVSFHFGKALDLQKTEPYEGVAKPYERILFPDRSVNEVKEHWNRQVRWLASFTTRNGL